MPKRECRLLVLSPRARSRDLVREYKPFGRKRLLDLMKEAAEDVAQLDMSDYDRHAVFEGFFFGTMMIDEMLRKELRKAVQSSLIDCLLYRSPETAAVESAKNALRHFKGDLGPRGKAIFLVCPDHCGVVLGFDADRAFEDAALRAHLAGELRSSLFRKILERGVGR
jgi:hypothetical protein